MDKDTKENLDMLVLGLQKSLVKWSKGSEVASTLQNRYYYQGQQQTCTKTIDSINTIFGTNYESFSDDLRKYFEPEKPCERS